MRPLILTMKSFGSYGNETTIDFSKTTQNLFLITGDTGAGKTTIFDAIVFALYGQTGSLYNKKEDVQLQSQFTSYENAPQVIFRFAKSARDESPVYTIRRVPKHLRPAKRRGSSGKGFIEEKGFVELVLPDGSVYAEKNVNEKIEEVVGLTRAQFMQVAMIAQGEFMELLRAKTDDKKEIFRKLFNTELYERIKRILEDRKKEKEKEIAIIKTTCRNEIAHVTITEDFEKYAEINTCAENIKNEKLVYLSEYLVLLEEFCSYSQDKIESAIKVKDAAKQALDTAQSDYAKAKALMDAFTAYELADAVLAECREMEKEMREKNELADMLGEAYEIEPVYRRYQDAKQDLKDIEQKLSDKESLLPQLEENCANNDAVFEKISVHYENEKKILHEMSRKSEEAMHLFDRRDKIEQEKKDKYAECLAAEKERHKLENRLEEMRKRREKCDEELKGYNEALEQKLKSENELQRNEALGRQIAAVYESKKDIAVYESRLEKSQDEFRAAEAEYREKITYYEAVNSRFLNEQAGILAKSLIDGEPCKVCGSCVHPMPYKIPQDFQVPTQEHVEAARRESEERNRRQQKKSLEANELKTILDGKTSQYVSECAKICAELDIQDVSADIDAISKTFKDYSEDVNKKYQCHKERCVFLEGQKVEQEKCVQNMGRLQDRLEKANAQIANLNRQISGLEATLKELENNTEFETRQAAESAKINAEAKFSIIKKEYEEKEKADKKAHREKEDAMSLIKEYKMTIPSKQNRVKTQKAEYEKILQQKSTENTSEYEKKRQGIIALYSRETLSEWKRQLKQYFEKVQEAKAKKVTALDIIKENRKPDIENLQQSISVLKADYDKWNNVIYDISQIQTVNKRALTLLKSQMNQREKTIHEYTTLDGLYRIISGNVNKQNKMDLETFAQRYYLKKILTAANRRFEKMTAGQFRLLIKDIDEAGKVKNEGLDLMVYSLVTGKKRDVRTLSGGESFIAALSLALGMADQIKEGSGAVNLDMMFIDEGFGSLDEHSRGQAVRILKEMAGGSRMIGIISHVTELKQEIENQLIVTKNESGSGVQWRIS